MGPATNAQFNTQLEITGNLGYRLEFVRYDNTEPLIDHAYGRKWQYRDDPAKTGSSSTYYISTWRFKIVNAGVETVHLGLECILPESTVFNYWQFAVAGATQYPDISMAVDGMVGSGGYYQASATVTSNHPGQPGIQLVPITIKAYGGSPIVGTTLYTTSVLTGNIEITWS